MDRLEDEDKSEMKYLKELSKKYKEINKSFGPFGNVGHGVSGGNRRSSGRQSSGRQSSKGKRRVAKPRIEIFKEMKGGKIKKIPTNKLYVSHPEKSGLIKLKDFLVNAGKKILDFGKPLIQKGAEKLLEKGVERLATKFSGKGVSGGKRQSSGSRGRKSSGGYVIRKTFGGPKGRSKDIIERYASILKQGSGVRKSAKKSRKGGASNSNTWREFAVSMYNDMKDKDPSVKYKDVLKLASKEWKKMH